MNLAYDNSECYLASPSGRPISVLNGIDILSANLSKNMSDFSEFSCDLWRFIDINGELVESSGYNFVKNGMYLYLTNAGWFKIVNEPQLTNDSDKEMKHIVAESVECELLQYDLVGFKVNTGELDSLEYLATDNIAANNLAKEYVLFYKPSNPQLSLLHLVLDKVRGWEIGYVDPDLADKKFTFNINSKPIHSFMRDDLQKQARCIFVFNNFNRNIDVYSIENYGVDTNIYISMRNLAKSIDITCEDRSIYTCYNVAGGDGLDNINQVNFGTSYIEDLSYYMCYPYMEQNLIDKYQSWLDFREIQREHYIHSSKQYQYEYASALEFKNRVPIEDLTHTWENYTLEELIKYKAFYEANISDIETELGTDEEIIKEYPIWHNYMQYKEIIRNIDFAIIAIETNTNAEYVDWTTNTELYGVDELTYKVESYKEQLDIFQDYKNDFIDTDGNYRTWDSLSTEELKKYATQSEYEQKKEHYIKISNLYTSFSDALLERTAEYTYAMSKADGYLNHIIKLNELASIENFSVPFTDEELEVLNRLRTYTDYKNENILITSTYNTEQEILAQKDLLEDAKEQLVISSQPQINFSISIDNLSAIDEFKKWAEVLDVGAFVYLEVRENYIVKLRVAEISGINPFDNKESDLTISFSNMIKGIHGINDFNYLLNTSINASKNSIGVEKTSSTPTVSSSITIDDINISSELLNKIANSDVFINKFETIIESNTLDTDKKVNESIANIVIEGGGGKVDVNYSNLVATNSNMITVKNVENEIIKYKLTATQDSEMVLLLTIPFSSNLDGNLILRYYINNSLIDEQTVRKYFEKGDDVLSVCTFFPN